MEQPLSLSVAGAFACQLLVPAGLAGGSACPTSVFITFGGPQARGSGFQ